MSRWLRADPLRAVLAVIALITVASGATQLVAPSFVLGLLGVELSAATAQLFATVGMFMVIVGGALFHSLVAGGDQRIIVFWGALQKLGAFLAVAVGVLLRVFAPIALGVAFFDLATSALLVWYLVRLRQSRAPGRSGGSSGRSSDSPPQSGGSPPQSGGSR